MLPEVMVPLVGHRTDLAHQEKIVLRVAEQVFAEQGQRVEFTVGTMIEVPRAALRAGEIAEEAELLSGFSRDDVTGFLPKYLAQGALEDDPFQTIDVDDVGQLLQQATERGRAQRPGMKIGVCGDPRSIVLRQDRARLRELFTLPGAGRAPRSRAVRAEKRGVQAKEGES